MIGSIKIAALVGVSLLSVAGLGTRTLMHRTPPTITSFGTYSCTPSAHSNTYTFNWTVSGETDPYTWEVRDTESADAEPGTGTLQGSGGNGTTSATFSVTTAPGPNQHWFWLRYSNGTDDTGWVGQDNNAWNVTSGCPV